MGWGWGFRGRLPVPAPQVTGQRNVHGSNWLWWEKHIPCICASITEKLTNCLVITQIVNSVHGFTFSLYSLHIYASITTKLTNCLVITQIVNSVCGFTFSLYSLHICDPTAQNQSHWYSVKIQSATIFDLQVKNIDFQFSSKSGALHIFQFENITFNGQIWCFVTVSEEERRRNTV